VRGGGAGEIVRYAIIVASFLAANAGATEIDSPRHPFLLRRTDHTRLYPKAWVTTTARDQAVLDRVSSEGQFPAYHRYLATRSYRHNRLKLHNRSAGLTSISTDPPRVTKFRAQLSRREARRSGPAIRQTQALKPAVSAKPPTDRADRPTSQVGIFSAPQAASTTTVPESNHDESGSAFALSPPPALAEPPSSPAEPQRQSQEEKAQQTQQTPSVEMAKEEPGAQAETAKSQVSAVLVNGVLAVPGAAIDTDTTPSKFSEKNAADDKLSTLAYAFKLLSREERSAIYQALKGQPGGRALKADIGTKLPLGIELRAVPDELTVRVPQTRGYHYTVAGNEVLLISPLTRAVVGVFSDRD
jgi:hypothetical protein